MNAPAFNEGMRPAEPTFGCVILAELNAADIEHSLCQARLAVAQMPRDMDLYSSHVRAAQLKLADLARRLGYDLIPTTAERVDA